MISADVACEFLSYEPETGWLTWIKQSSTRTPIGARAGCVRADKRGRLRRQVRLLGKLYYEHRLIWLMVHGYWPPIEIDHKNGDGLDNRLDNLRPATRTQNARNIRSKSPGSGLKGAFYDKRRAKWFSAIRTDAGRKFLGYFDGAQPAHDAYAAAATIHHGEFARAA